MSRAWRFFAKRLRLNWDCCAASLTNWSILFYRIWLGKVLPSSLSKYFLTKKKINYWNSKGILWNSSDCSAFHDWRRVYAVLLPYFNLNYYTPSNLLLTYFWHYEGITSLLSSFSTANNWIIQRHWTFFTVYLAWFSIFRYKRANRRT